MKGLIALIVVAIIGLIVLRQSLYIVDETEQVIILRFQELIQERTGPGLYIKAPFIDAVVRFDKRVLRIDAPPETMPDIQKENLRIDSYARYRITNMRRFRETLNSELTARSRLGDIVNASLRGEIARRDRIEIIGARPDLDENSVQRVDEEGIPLYLGTESRSEILSQVLDEVKRRVAEQNFGVEIIDVRIMRADFPEDVTPSIYTRMRAERNRIASRFRAEGDERDLRIRADADKEVTIIRAEAQRQSEQIRGEGEARAIALLAEALNQDPEFFAFRRSLQAYQNLLGQGDTIVLSSDAPLFDYLGGPQSGGITPN